MNKKEEFKKFAYNHPELSEYVQKGEMTWQKFYELYDIYGAEHNIWQSYGKTSREGTLSNITNLVKKVDINEVEKHIGTVGKAIDLFKEFGTKKTVSEVGKAMDILDAKPIENLFED